MTTEQRLKELAEMTAELSRLIEKLGLLNEMVTGALAETRTVMDDTSNFVRWAIQGK